MHEASSQRDAAADGAAAAIVAEEAPSGQSDISGLRSWLEHQQTWSDFPFVLLSMPGQDADEQRSALRKTLGNVTILERPLRPDTIVRAVKATARARRRQFQAADLLNERTRAEAQLRAGEERLRELNETLEARVSERTVSIPMIGVTAPISALRNCPTKQRGQRESSVTRRVSKYFITLLQS